MAKLLSGSLDKRSLLLSPPPPPSPQSPPPFPQLSTTNPPSRIPYSLPLPSFLANDEDDDHQPHNQHLSKDEIGPTIASAGGFWALPARPEYGQLWSFASEMVSNSQQQHQQQSHLASLRFLQQHQSLGLGEASAARVGNYLPMGHHLNLLAALSV